MACAPPKTCRNQQKFWDPSTKPKYHGSGLGFFHFKKHVLVGHPTVYSIGHTADVMKGASPFENIQK